jgi:hypothetical protein
VSGCLSYEVQTKHLVTNLCWKHYQACLGSFPRVCCRRGTKQLEKRQHKDEFGYWKDTCTDVAKILPNSFIWPMLVGMFPVRVLPCRPKPSAREKKCESVNAVKQKSMRQRSSLRSLVRLPISAGMVPSRAQSLMKRCSRLSS